MKPSCLIFSVGVVSAAPVLWAFPPSFNGPTLAAPTLSLRESIADGSLLAALPVVRKDAGRHRGMKEPRRARLERAGPGRMPVIEPDADTDFRLLVQTPDESFDYKMLTRETWSKPAKARR